MRFFDRTKTALIRAERHNYTCFELSQLNLHVPIKSKKQRANRKSYTMKTLREAIMKQSQLASKYHATKNTKVTTNSRNK